MSATQFRTIPKEEFTTVLLYFQEAEAIGDRDEGCGVLKVGGNVTPRDPKEEGGYEDVEIPNFLGVTIACKKRLDIATKGCGQLLSNDTYFSDSWFISVKTDEQMAAAGVNYCGPVKTSHKVFFQICQKS